MCPHRHKQNGLRVFTWNEMLFYFLPSVILARALKTTREQ